jgi:hypothetical protein
MRDSEELHVQHRAQYLDAKAKYAGKKKSISWKEYCNMTSSTNTNTVCWLATGKRKKYYTTNYIGRARRITNSGLT